jgi:peptidoglycan L-alanyl-D-glutamate endopeptidase CwlK
MTEDRNLANLHPVFREKVKELLKIIEDERLPFKLFEGYRSASRQAKLYAQGRTAPGNIVTKARPWTSNHQYGLAGDFVLFVNGDWSWSESGKYAYMWKRLHDIGRSLGLTPLSWEVPHLELVGLKTAALREGDYPAGGDKSWADNLTRAIDDWDGDDAPPYPEIKEISEPVDIPVAPIDVPIPEDYEPPILPPNPTPGIVDIGLKLLKFIFKGKK